MDLSMKPQLLPFLEDTSFKKQKGDIVFKLDLERTYDKTFINLLKSEIPRHHAFANKLFII
ncbi:hypothetical protein CR513_61083, partial [Mucuna pruriens]